MDRGSVLPGQAADHGYPWVLGRACAPGEGRGHWSCCRLWLSSFSAGPPWRALTAPRAGKAQVGSLGLVE